MSAEQKFLNLMRYIQEVYNIKVKNESKLSDYKWHKYLSEEELKEASEATSIFVSWLKPEKLTENKEIDQKRENYYKLYEVYRDLQRNQDDLELILGCGEFTFNGKKSLPLVFQKVELKLDPLANKLSVWALEDEARINSSAFENLEGLDLTAFNYAQEILASGELKLLNELVMQDFFKKFMIKLCQNKEPLRISLNPVLFIRERRQGIIPAVKSIEKAIKDGALIPNHLAQLLEGSKKKEQQGFSFNKSVEEKLAEVSGESQDILLAKETNKEQLEIATRMAESDAIRVQGPPGTGKTHTIANLLGHFLAEGKSVLVTSHTQKALSVLKDKLPKGIQALCVAYFGNNPRELQKSVESILEMQSEPLNSLKDRRLKNWQKREEILDELWIIRRKLFNIKYSEYKKIVYAGEGYSLLEIAEYLRENKEKLSTVIPDQVTKESEIFPFKINELIELYASNKGLSKDENPKLASLASVLEAKEAKEDELFSKYPKANIDYNALEFFKNKLDVNRKNGEINNLEFPESFLRLRKQVEYLKEKSKVENWVRACMISVLRDTPDKAKWQKLSECLTNFSSYREFLFNERVAIASDITNLMLKDELKVMKELFSKGKTMPFYKKIFNKNYQKVEEGVKLDGLQLKTVSDIEYVEGFLEAKRKKEELKKLWENLVTVNGGVKFSELDLYSLRVIDEINSKIEVALLWYHEEYPLDLKLIKSAGFNPKNYQLKADEENYKLTGIEHFNLLVQRCYEKFPEDFELTLAEFELLRAKKVYETLILELEEKREKLLCKLAKDFPKWALKIRQKEGIHGKPTYPSNIFEAWKYKQLELILNKHYEESFSELQVKAEQLVKELKDVTEKLVVELAWEKLLERNEADMSVGHALNSWKYFMTKYGRGSGKDANKYLRKARRSILSCQKAVPAWIIPEMQVLTTFVPGKNVFDVVIIDEASQSDIFALPILYMAKKVIVVGDDKQVSPLAIGQKDAQVEKLQKAYLQNIMSPELYSLDSSIYDIVGATYKTLMLKEHFRSTPDIIGFSNMLCYDYKIKPLRDASSSKLLPSIISYRTNGKSLEGRKINKEEALRIVAFILACLELEEYKDKSIGVISLVGSEQAQLIDRILHTKLKAKTIKDHRIICGSSAQFQGDERDVIFLSMVDSNEAIEPLPLRREGRNNMFLQRYNVAVSRARDQLWIIHSLDVEQDLKIGDIRRKLLEYAQNPQGARQRQEQIKKQADSPFEEEVAKRLVKDGYRITQQWQVGSYRIDLVAQYKNKKVAIECDGNRYHSTMEQVERDMQRQTVLERVGWTFIRIRGSEFYLNKEKAIARIEEELEAKGILKEESVVFNKDKGPSSKTSELYEKVKIIAEEKIRGLKI